MIIDKYELFTVIDIDVEVFLIPSLHHFIYGGHRELSIWYTLSYIPVQTWWSKDGHTSLAQPCLNSYVCSSTDMCLKILEGSTHMREKCHRQQYSEGKSGSLIRGHFWKCSGYHVVPGIKQGSGTCKARKCLNLYALSGPISWNSSLMFCLIKQIFYW